MQCVVDLQNDVLRIGQATTPFLAEKDIPKQCELSLLCPSDRCSLLHFAEAVNDDSSSVTSTETVASTSTQPAAPPTPLFSEEAINKLVSLGFSREQAVVALRQCNGNLDLAASMLFQ